MNWNKTYVQVNNKTMKAIQEMKEKERAIPHYKAKVKDIEGFEVLSKMEKMELLKHNLDEINKQYKNEYDKGMIGTCGYTQFAKREKYVFPILDDLFKIDDLRSFINNSIHDIIFANITDEDEALRNAVGSYIRFIDGVREEIIRNIIQAHNVESIKIKYRLSKIESRMGDFLIYDNIMFWLENDKNVTIVKCNSMTGKSNKFEKEEAEKSWYCAVGHKKYPLSIWEDLEKNTNF